jgi:hypothetical protein
LHKTNSNELNKSQTQLNVPTEPHVTFRDKSPQQKQTAAQVEHQQAITNIFSKREAKPSVPNRLELNDPQTKQPIIPPPPPPPNAQLNSTTVNTNSETSQGETIVKINASPIPPPPPPPQLNFIPVKASQETPEASTINKSNAPPIPPPPAPPLPVNTSSIPPPPPPPPPISSNGSFIPPPPPPPPPFPSTVSSGAFIPPPPPPPPNIAGSIPPPPPPAANSMFPPPPPPMALVEDPTSNQNIIYKTLPKSKKALKNLGWTKLPNTALGK